MVFLAENEPFVDKKARRGKYDNYLWGGAHPVRIV